MTELSGLSKPIIARFPPLQFNLPIIAVPCRTSHVLPYSACPLGVLAEQKRFPGRSVLRAGSRGRFRLRSRRSAACFRWCSRPVSDCRPGPRESSRRLLLEAFWWVCRSHAGFIVPNGCSTVSRRWRWLVGLNQSAAARAS